MKDHKNKKKRSRMKMKSSGRKFEIRLACTGEEEQARTAGGRQRLLEGCKEDKRKERGAVATLRKWRATGTHSRREKRRECV